jgi:glycoprotein 3-alpha-L-fucosyltransferase
MPPSCGRFVNTSTQVRCFHELGSRYKFYLALENSDCDDYVTEKVFRNALKSGMIPVVCCSPLLFLM